MSSVSRIVIWNAFGEERGGEGKMGEAGNGNRKCGRKLFHASIEAARGPSKREEVLAIACARNPRASCG